MGSMKEDAMQDEEYNRDKILAEILGITVDELHQTEWELDDESASQLVVSFTEDSPKNILEKIKGLDESNMVWLDKHALENRSTK